MSTIIQIISHKQIRTPKSLGVIQNTLWETRQWLRDDYIKRGKFQNYIDGKVKQNQLPVSFAQLAISAYKDE